MAPRVVTPVEAIEPLVVETIELCFDPLLLSQFGHAGLHFFQNVVKWGTLEIVSFIDEKKDLTVLESVQLFNFTYVTVWYPRSSPSLNFR